MPHHRFSKVLSKQLVDIVNEYLLPHDSEYLFVYDKVMFELDEIAHCGIIRVQCYKGRYKVLFKLITELY